VQAAPNTTQNYELTSTFQQCYDTLGIAVNVNTDTPQANVAVSATEICGTEAINFDGSSSVNTGVYDWYFEGGTPDTSALTQPTITYDTAGTYDVQLIAINGCGRDTLSKTDHITVQPTPRLSVSPDQSTVCQGDSLTLQATTSPPVTYNWSTGDTTASVNVIPQSDTNYIVQATTTEGCSETDTASFTTKTAPLANFGYEVNDLTVDFSDSSQQVQSYDWQFGDNNSSNFPNPEHTYSTPDTYRVTLTVTHSNGCTDQKMEYIVVGETGIFERPEGSLQIQPNPADRQLLITLESTPTAPLELSMYNAVGERVAHQNVSLNTDNSYEWSLPDLAEGLYFVKIQTEQRQYLRKVTIQQ
jgi:PKD repeat protein